MTNLSVPKSQSPRLSDPVQLKTGVTLQWEPFHLVANEIRALLLLHWHEVALNHGTIAMAPDWDRYLAFERAGIFKVVTVRKGYDLVGYSTWMVMPHLHYADTLWAHNDVMWVHPLYRQGMTGVRMLRFALKGLRAAGVRMVHATAMDHFESERGGLGKVFQFLGFQRIQSVYAIDLEANHEQRQPASPA